MNYCVLYCVGGCGSVLTGYLETDDAHEGSADGNFVCEDCKWIDRSKLSAFAKFAQNEAEIIKDRRWYQTWVKTKQE